MKIFHIVRKTGWIVLGAILLLLCSDGQQKVHATASVAGTNLSLTVADSAAERMSCERTYNSDLNLLTRLASESVPAQSVVPGMRAGSCFGRASAHHDTTAWANGTMCAVSRVKFIPTLFAGVPAVDYYVYRLHRLII